jgi:hypothetical protein
MPRNDLIGNDLSTCLMSTRGIVLFSYLNANPFGYFHPSLACYVQFSGDTNPGGTQTPVSYWTDPA